MRVKHIIVFIPLLALYLGTAAQSKAPVIVLQNQTEVTLIGKQVYFFEDSGAILTIQNIQSAATQSKFRLLKKDAYNNRVTPNAVWFKIELQNKTGEDAWLETGGPYSCWYIDFYRPDSLGRYGYPVQTGSMRPVESKEYPVNFFWLKLANAADTSVKTYYVRMFSGRDAEYPLLAGTIKALYSNKEKSDYLTAGFVGIMLIMIFYNVFLCVATRDRIYIIYVCYLISSLLGVCYLNNHSPFPPHSWADTHYYAWANCSFLLIGLFTSEYLQLKKHYPRLFWLVWSQVFVLGVVFPTLSGIGVPMVKITTLHNICLLLFNITFLISGVYLYAKGGNIARFYFLGWIFIAISMVVLQLEVHGILPYHLILRNALYFGVTLEMLMFSFALGERLNILKFEKENAQFEYLRLVAAQTKELEQKVEARTRELQDQSNYLEEVNATKDNLFSILGHDLRGPIANLKGMLDLSLANEISSEEFQKHMPVLNNGVENVLTILEDLLQWSYAQRKGITSFPVYVDLHAIAENTVMLFGAQTTAKSILLQNQIPPNSAAFVDENQIKLILRNLVSNSVKFTPKNGSILITSTVVGNMNQIAVTDTGKGMSLEETEKLFKATSNFTTPGTAGEKGIGLGLLLCREMAENNGGKIWVSSTKGVGTTFYFTVPLKKMGA